MSQKRKKQIKNSDVKSSGVDKRLFRYYALYWKLLVLGLVCTGVIAVIQVIFLRLIKNIVNATTLRDSNLLAMTALFIVGIHVAKWFFTYGQVYFMQSATNKIAVRIRNELYAHIQSLSLSYFERTKIGHLMSKMTNDVGLIQSSAGQIIKVVQSPLVVVGVTIEIFRSNWKLALISVTVLPLMYYTIMRISKGMRRLTELLQIDLAEVAAVVQESLSGVRIIKSFGTEDYEIARFYKENERTYGAAMKSVRRSAAVTPTLEVIGVTGIAFVLWYGGSMVAHESVRGFRVGELVAFLVALERIGASFRDIGGINVTYHSTMAAAQRIFDVMDEVPEIRDAPDAAEMPPMKGLVEFRSVSFAYNRNKPVLTDISFTAEPGQQIALVGPSGAGKSTIANLLPRLYDVTDGAVLIDGVDVRNVTQNSLRKQIAIVPQETMLFGTSIRENIAYGRMAASEEEIYEAAKAANAHDFITRLPEGYDTMVGERGARLSGGERQRVSIARALLKNPKLLILDEATSSLDVASEAVVQEALERLMQNRTTVVIAHRLSTIVGADKILVMNQGRIVESGTHLELLAFGGLYAELYMVQSKGNPPIGGKRERVS